MEMKIVIEFTLVQKFGQKERGICVYHRRVAFKDGSLP